MCILKTELIEDKTKVSEAQEKSRSSKEISFLF
jgi:hypothetical protein